MYNANEFQKRLALTRQLTRREIEQRYRGSVLGVAWSFVTPLFMLAVFTFVFAVVIQARWSQGSSDTVEFAIILFAGLTTFGIFAEVVSRAPTLIVGQPNLVKKVVFPLSILPIVALGSALVQASIAALILLVFQAVLGSGFQATSLALPAIVLPLCFFTLGLGWFLAALGVYVRDVAQLIPPLVTALMFLSPIFYPISALPEWLRPMAIYSPIAYSIEAVRDAAVFGRLPGIAPWLLNTAAALVVAALGFAFFRKTRKGFADVL